MADKGFTYAGVTSVYDPSLSTAFTTGVWKNCPLASHRHDPTIGVLLDDGCTSYNATATTGDYLLTQAGAAGSAAMSTTHPGCLAIDAGAATSTQGANVQRLKSMFIPAANKSIWGEFRVRMGTTNVAEVFIGLAASDTTIIASSAMNVNNHLGWQCLTDDGVLLFDSDKAGTGTTQASTTITTSAWLNLGFFYDGVADTLTQFVNGVATGTAIATANIAKLAMYPSFVCQGAGTGQPVLLVGGYRIFQLR